jgi:hypothetical protein
MHRLRGNKEEGLSLRFLGSCGDLIDAEGQSAHVDAP